VTQVIAAERTYEQRIEALKLANAVRTARRDTKLAVKLGEQSFEDSLLNPPEHMCSMKIGDYLLCIPRVGRVKAAKVLRRTQTASTKTLASLSDRQRKEIAAALGGAR